MRQRIVILFLIVGIFPSIQAAFACEKIDDRIQFKPITIEMESSEEMQGCENSANNLDLTAVDSCCDATSHIIGHVRNNIQDFSLDKILMLDGAQPPPVILNNNIELFIAESVFYPRLLALKYVKTSASNTYLVTQRFRI